jgi:hypothetical protein
LSAVLFWQLSLFVFASRSLSFWVFFITELLRKLLQ